MSVQLSFPLKGNALKRHCKCHFCKLIMFILEEERTICSLKTIIKVVWVVILIIVLQWPLAQSLSLAAVPGSRLFLVPTATTWFSKTVPNKMMD